MKQRTRQFDTILLCLMSLLAVASAAGCGGSGHATAQPTVATATAVATAPPATSAPTPSAAGATATSGQQAPSTPANGRPTDLGWRVAIGGPATARPGDEATYEIRYDCIREAPPCQQLGLEYGWTEAGASVVSSSRPGHVGADGHGLAWAVDQSGAIQVVLRVADGFQGDLHMGVYTVGNNITYSAGSVDQYDTIVSSTP